MKEGKLNLKDENRQKTILGGQSQNNSKCTYTTNFIMPPNKTA